MTLNIVSDIHWRNPYVKYDKKFGKCVVGPDIDFYKFNWKADYQVMAGDIGSYYGDIEIFRDIRSAIWSTMDRPKPWFIYTEGNHDFWYPWIEPDVYKNPIKKSVLFIERESDDFIIDYTKVCFISCPLFTYLEDYVYDLDFDELQDYQNFKVRFSKYNVGKEDFITCWNNTFKYYINYIKESINNCRKTHDDYKIIVVTHFVPKTELIKNSIMYGHKLNPFWASKDATEFLDGNLPDIWIHGHSHEFCDETINGVRYIRNPLRDYNMNIIESAYSFTIKI